MSTAVRDNDQRSRFEAWVDGEFAGFADHVRTGDLVVYPHTEVRAEFEGRGVGGALARTALEDADRRGLRVLATCPFIIGWLERHPEYQHLTQSA
ncbi:GNAT family N-acetyltransferase [Streptomyces sp. NBRC 109706]|uniref:GNAT family N-acetyltransferase n=1 Tax=Streptomyces sp. NBRC 109706 TaxID=1550035 RepID=UPI0007821102|nr:GNAT family N-acetyltransferase [Streptomyces sp. NBRC 109706]